MEGCTIKIDRLLGITTYLLNREIVSARVLAERFEVSRRTIQRDIDALCLAGIPVMTRHGSGGGYGIAGEFSLDKQIYSPADYQNIMIALKGFCSAYIKGKADPTLEKVFSTFSPQKQSVALDFGALREGDNLERTFSLLEQAILTETIVEMDYSDAGGRVSTRRVEPLLLTCQWYSWYLLAYCQQKKAYRLFKLSRIIRLEHRNQLFSLQHGDAARILAECRGRDTRKYWKIKLYCQPGPAILIISKALERRMIMDTIRRNLINEEFALAGIVEAGDFVFLTFCVGNVGESVEAQVNGALDDMSRRLETIGLTLDAVVQVSVLLRDPWNIPVMERVFKERFKGKYPARKTISSEFAHRGGPDGLHVQIDAIAYRK